jgi:hypothetical protein
MENTTAVEEKALRPRIEKYSSLRRHRNGKTRHTKQAFMIVQSIDKLPVASGDRVALLGVTCIWFSSDLKLQKSRFSTKDIIKTSQ